MPLALSAWKGVCLTLYPGDQGLLDMPAFFMDKNCILGAMNPFHPEDTAAE